MERELEAMLEQLQEVEKGVFLIAEGMGCDPYRVQDSNGRLMMIDVITAKASVLVALSNWKREQQ